jgi:Amt family ammonium transporter
VETGKGNGVVKTMETAGKVRGCLRVAGWVTVFAAAAAAADGGTEAAAVKEELQTNLNIVWTCLAAFLVFFMQAGFALVETGFTRAKNAVNILMKNLMDFSVGSLAFFLVGFGLMFGATNGLFYGHGFQQLGVQLLGAGTAFVWAFGLGLVLFLALKKTVGLRVSAEEEIKGLDIEEHGNEAYAGFQVFTTE